MSERTVMPARRRLLRFVRAVVEALYLHHAFDHAATMTFYFFLGAIPLLVLVGLLIGNLVQREGAVALAAPLYSVMPNVVADLFRSELHQIGQARGTTAGPLSFIGFVWLTTNGIHNLMDVFEILVGARPRKWLRQRVIATLWVAAALVALVAATWILFRFNAATLGTKSVTRILAAGWKHVGVLLVFPAFAAVALAVFYRTSVDHRSEVRRRVWPGTLVALSSWVLVSWAFGTYVKTLGHYAIYYGSLATVAVVLLWLYLTSLALLVGAEVNAQLEGSRAPRGAL
jgi:membrane protein